MIAVKQLTVNEITNLLQILGQGNLDTEKLLAQATAANLAVEQMLVENSGLARSDLIRAILELKDAYGLPFDKDYVEVNIPFFVPRADAERLHIIPLALLGHRLYFLAEKGAVHAALDEALTKQGFQPVCLGETEIFADTVQKLFTSLAHYDAQNQKFGDYLVNQKLATREQVADALRQQKEKGWHLGQTIIKKGILTEQLLYEVLAAYLNFPYYSMGRMIELADRQVTSVLARVYAQRNLILALRKTADTVWVATSEPHNTDVLDAVGKVFACPRVHVGIASETDILNVMDTLYGVEEDKRQLFMDLPGETAEVPVDERGLYVNRADVPRFVQYILYSGVRMKASDIHIERYESRVDLKYRVDGYLVPATDSPLTLTNITAVVAKLKVDARLDIAERRRPQDGVIRRRFGRHIIDFRIAVQPTLWGENVAIRILNQTLNVPQLDQLGFPGDTLKQLRRLLQNPQGLILVTGPTGCGKTTTLYSALLELKGTHVKIVTAEDPIEYAIDGIQQSQVNEPIGNTFDRYLRAFLRQDPDVILVGEIRDRLTAEMAVRAALTGHLIFSTLHVNDALGVVRRLIDLGIEPNLVSQTLLCVVSQRLVRKVCPHCADPKIPDARTAAEFYQKGLPEGAMFRIGRGCAACNHTGYSGRLAAVEYWEPTDLARSIIDTTAEVGS